MDVLRYENKKGNLKRETESILIAAQKKLSEQILSKQEYIRHNKARSISYVKIELKASIT